MHFNNPDLVRVGTGWQASPDRSDAGLAASSPLPAGNSGTSTLTAHTEPQRHGHAAGPRRFGPTARGAPRAAGSRQSSTPRGGRRSRQRNTAQRAAEAREGPFVSATGELRGTRGPRPGARRRARAGLPPRLPAPALPPALLPAAKRAPEGSLRLLASPAEGRRRPGVRGSGTSLSVARDQALG